MSKALDEFASQIAGRFPASPRSVKQATAIVAALVEFLGRDRLLESAQSATDWKAALDIYEGHDAVALMTIHKSKGLEYHSAVFMGLDDAAWWSYNKDTIESTAGFFVAFTRAKQRVLFTYCPTRGDRRSIQPLYALLDRAGVQTIAKM